ncbi:MAG: hypothetical protein JWR27_3036 [Aeromicrobium sp.]|nr:hypothetical protein [Aeromicrobium sp.]
MITSTFSRRGSRARTAWWAAIVLALAPLVTISPAGAATDEPRTVVSLTFDDGNADQMSPAAILEAHGMAGTFYINSGKVGLAGYMTRANIATLALAGHEIGGHTLNHPSLPSLPADEAKRQICLDRDNLMEWGYAVRSFAYPFAETTTAINQLVADCGYNSGRNVGGLRSRMDCAGCSYTESFTPAAPYSTKALDIDNAWTLQDLKDAVTNAETTGGGWVPMTFHHVCSTPCGELAIDEQIFTEFLDWLQLRDTSNNTTVMTLGDVIGGDVKPVVAVSDPVPTQDGSGLSNPGMETLRPTGLPSCWQSDRSGVNTAVFDTVTPGRTGQRAGRVTVSGYTSGDAKLLTSLDLGTCAPPATPGKSYVLRSWYTSTARTQYDVYLRTSSGGWRYWTSSPFFAAASSWTRATWRTPEVPAGHDGISFGLNLVSTGTLVVDDFSLSTADATPKTSVTILPEVADGADGWFTTRPTVALSVDAGSEASQPEYSFDSTTWTPYTAPIDIPDQAQPLRYRSRNGGMVEETRTLDVKVDTVRPVVAATFDAATRTITASATDTQGSGVASVEKRVVGAAFWEPVTAPVAASSEATELEFRAIDRAGNVSTTQALSVPAAQVATASIVPGTPDGAAGWYVTRPKVALAKTGNAASATVEYSFNGTTWKAYSAPVAIPDGAQTLRYRTVIGREKGATETFAVKVDTVKPVISTATFNKTTRTVTVKATDATSTVDRVERRISGGEWQTLTGTLALGDDAAQVEIRAFDRAGNESAPRSVTVAARTAVTVGVSLSTASTTYGKTVKATVTVPNPSTKASTPTGTVTVSVDGTALAPAKLSKGKAIVTLPSTLSVASHTVTATYSGDTGYRPGAATAVEVTITKATPTVSFSRSTTKPKVNKTVVTLTTKVSVSGTKVVPVGQLQVYAAGNVIATVPLMPANKGTIKIALPVFTTTGTVPLEVQFLSTAELDQATSKTSSVTVVP